MARVLITGGSGFVGRAVARRLVQNGARVCAVSRTGGPPSAVADDWCRSPLIDWACLDCTDTEQMQQLIQDFKPTAYVHTVGALLEKSHYKSIIESPYSLHVQNLDGKYSAFFFINIVWSSERVGSPLQYFHHTCTRGPFGGRTTEKPGEV